MRRPRPATNAVIITLPPSGLGELGHDDPGKNPPARGIFNAKCRAVAEVLELLLGYAPCPQVLHGPVEAVAPCKGVAPFVDEHAHCCAWPQPVVQVNHESSRPPHTEAVEVCPNAAGAHDHRVAGRCVEPEPLDRRGEEPVAGPRQERVFGAAGRAGRRCLLRSCYRQGNMAAAAYRSARW